MPTTQTLKPNGTATAPPASTVWNGSAFVASTGYHTYVSDGLANTMLKASTTFQAVLDVETYLLQANERCLRVRVGQRGFNGNSNEDLRVNLRYSGFIGGPAQFSFMSGTSHFDTLGAWLNNPPSTAVGTEWTQAIIDAVRVQVDSTATAGTPTAYAEQSEVWVELDIHIKPSVTIASPVGGQTVYTTTSPIQWDYSGDGDAQKKYQMKVFDRTVVEGGGFDVTTSTAVYDSGEQQTSASNAAPGNLVDGGQYYVYVKVAKDFNGQDWWSDWSASRFFKVNAKPTCTITGPALTVTTTSRPTVTWTYADADGDVMTAWRVQLYEQPVGGWGNFIPPPGSYYAPSTNPIWDSVPAGSAPGYFNAGAVLSARIPIPLKPTQSYRAYVRVRHGAPVQKTSDFIYREFTTNLPVPQAPTLTAVSGNRDSVQLTLTKGAGVVDGQVTWYSIQRSFDGGVTWDFFRYGTASTTEQLPEIRSPSTSVVYNDPEVPVGVTVQYRAWAAYVSTEEFDSSMATASGTLTLPVIWLKDPIDSTRNRHFYVQDHFLPVKKTRVRSVQQPLGRDRPIVVRGDGKGRVFSMTFLLLGRPDYDAMMLLAESDRTLYLQTPKESYYVDIGGDMDIGPHVWDRLHGEEDVWTCTVPFIEVDDF